MVKNILFVCKYNRFRSRIAEDYFRKINKNTEIKVESAGLIQGLPINKQQVELVKEFNINIEGTPRGLSEEMIRKADIIIVVADNVPKRIFSRDKGFFRKVKVWKIKDQKIEDREKSTELIKEIIKKVDNLKINMEKGRWLTKTM